jgi:hypothetical protein
MTAQIVEDHTPTKHAVRVNWFHREPGGSTIFVMPPDGDAATAQPTTQRDDGAAAAHVG